MESVTAILNGTAHNILNVAGCLILFLVICSYLKYRNGR